MNLLVDPRDAFQAIARRPAWLGMFAALVAIRFGSLFVFYRPDVTPVKLVVGVAFQVATVGGALLGGAGTLWAVSKLWGVRLGWVVALSIAVHVCVAYTIATTFAASVAGAILPASVDVDLRNPPFTSLRALIGESDASLPARLLGELDVRSAYALALIALGVRSAAPQAGWGRIVAVIGSCIALRLVGIAWSATS